MDVFLRDLNQAYSTGQLTIDDNSLMRYLDYAAIEQQIPMTAASMFWRETLQDCKIDRSLALPFDRYRLSDEHRTNRGTLLSFDFGQNLSHDFITYSSSNGITLEQLALGSYYVFLFKLTNGESDLCIGMNTHGRYKEELMSAIGMFVNAIPLRCQLDPHWSFPHLLEHVKEMFTSSLEYSYFPFQRIVAQHPNATKLAFLETLFEFQSYSSKSIKNEMMIGDARLYEKTFSIKIDQDEIMSKFDFILSIQYDSDTNQLSCIINASLDLFDRKTVNIIAQRFHSMLEQLFNVMDIPKYKAIYELSLILPDEKLIMKSTNNTEVLFPSGACIHHEFVRQVIGMMAIEMAGGVYCPLSPGDPEHRLHALVEQTQSRLVLVHNHTKTIFLNDVISIDIDPVLMNKNIESDADICLLTNVVVAPDYIAYIIFTSGSTGTPKAVSIGTYNELIYYHYLTRS
ncbi:unnamed protein product [Rotaria sordida]|uniref:Uncharacterized protein n=1 Tax=Rotaria sordida TaxID=392033 RepID=A0A815FUR1_9BILA|nr:unnamed protein product [Rotaria sordida]CAF1591055.1 unnamed protein product [Rotaria sordida]